MNNFLPEYLLAGYEQGGTTLLSEIFRTNGYESGFETGILLAASPSDFQLIQPFWDMLLDGWKISEVARELAVQGTVAQFYSTLLEAAFPRHSGPFFDKTPRYMQSLGLCLSRAPFLKGAVLIHRDPRAVFASNAKRLSPKLSVPDAIEANFGALAERYLSYFIGSIAHMSASNVMFVPFEELVSREDSWLKAIGFFSQGRAFIRRAAKSRFANVVSQQMETAKVVEFDTILKPDLQRRILEATRLAAPFIASPLERVKYEGLWIETLDRADQLLRSWDLPRVGLKVAGQYFEPLTYLIRYPDVLEAKINPVIHFELWGVHEGRKPA